MFFNEKIMSKKTKKLRFAGEDRNGCKFDFEVTDIRQLEGWPVGHAMKLYIPAGYQWSDYLSRADVMEACRKQDIKTVQTYDLGPEQPGDDWVSGGTPEPQPMAFARDPDIQTDMGRRMLDLMVELVELFDRKHRDYGPRNILSSGEPGVVVRCSDKVERLRHLLITNPGVQPNNEAIEDSWMDLSVHAAIGALVHKGEWK